MEREAAKEATALAEKLAKQRDRAEEEDVTDSDADDGFWSKPPPTEGQTPEGVGPGFTSGVHDVQEPSLLRSILL